MTVPTITALPEIPAYSDANFETKAPAVLSALRNTFVAEMNAAIAAINNYDYGAAVNISKVVGLTAGYIPYGAGTSALASNANLNYDAANSRLNTPVLRASTGVLFGTDTAAANTLDDYEEGTWTPAVVGGTSAGIGTYTYAVGRYTKIGRMVMCSCRIQISAHTGTGGIRITMPFTPNSYSPATFYYDSLVIGAGKQLVANIVPGINYLQLAAGDVAGGSTTPITLSDDSAFYITLSVMYEVQ